MATNPAPISELKLTTDETANEITGQGAGKITSDTIQSLKATVKPLFSEGKTVVLDFDACALSGQLRVGRDFCFERLRENREEPPEGDQLE